MKSYGHLLIGGLIAVLLTGDGLGGSQEFPQAKDCPHEPKQLYIPAGEF